MRVRLAVMVGVLGLSLAAVAAFTPPVSADCAESGDCEIAKPPHDSRLPVVVAHDSDPGAAGGSPTFEYSDGNRDPLRLPVVVAPEREPGPGTD